MAFIQTDEQMIFFSFKMAQIMSKKIKILAQKNNMARLFGEMTNSPALSE